MPDPTDTSATAPDPTPTDITADAMAALDAGIAAADESNPQPAPELAPDAAAPAADGAPDAQAQDGQPPADGEQSPAQPQERVPPADGQTPAEPDKPQPDADTEAEITALGLKDKTAERFRALAGEVKELAPIRDAMKAAGIDDVSRLPELVHRASVGEDMVKMVSDTGTSPQQYEMALDYLGLISKAQRGDMSAAGQAYEVMSKELAVLAQMLGKEVPGVHDPLAAHADLLAEVQSGDLPRARAMEIAATRAQGAYTSSAQRQQEQARQATEQARQAAFAGLQEYDAEMKATDPTYLAKRATLHGQVNEIMAKYPPHEWERRTAIAYARIQAPATAAPAAPAQPRPGPMRPNGPQPTMAPAFDDPMKALEFGIEQANNAA